MNCNTRAANQNAALSFSNRDFKDPAGADLLARTQDFFEWQQARQSQGYWPYNRSLDTAPGGSANIRDCRSIEFCGVNFASQDYLSLATSNALKQAAHEAIDQFGVHSAGSAAVLGNTQLSLKLESALAEFLKVEHVTLYPTGWAAGYGVSKGLIRKDDYIVLDVLSHTCLYEGAYAATRNVSAFRHLDHEHARQVLARIRRSDSKNAILVITEGLFSMDSDSPDIERLQSICSEYQATLMVDVAHDLGALGPRGAGYIGLQNMRGKVDLVMGSFSKSFGSNGGFVASHRASVKQFLKIFSPSQTFSNALSPAQAAVVLKALNIIQSEEGQILRDCLMQNVMRLRGQLTSSGLRLLGGPSPIVPVVIGREDVARVASSLLPQYGVLANLAEYPAVPESKARFRLQVMASHQAAEIEHAVQGIQKAIQMAQRQLQEGAV